MKGRKMRKEMRGIRYEDDEGNEGENLGGTRERGRERRKERGKDEENEEMWRDGRREKR